jgi:hypothetical protein
MPPATYTESPASRNERIGKHLAKCREYWLKCPAYLEEGDLCQAGEKAWGAVAQMTKAVASEQGWRHFLHRELLAAARQIADESDDPTGIRESINIVRTMHTNFYEVDLDRADTELGMARAAMLLEKFWELIPARHAGGRTFAEWLAETD